MPITTWKIKLGDEITLKILMMRISKKWYMGGFFIIFHRLFIDFA
jgi:hypothetical protein